MRRTEITGFVAISPPASLYDFSFLAPCPTNGIIIQGTEDKIVEEECVTELVEKLNKQKNLKIEYKKIIGADHFFAKSLDDIQNKIEKYISKNANKSGKSNNPPEAWFLTPVIFSHVKGMPLKLLDAK